MAAVTGPASSTDTAIARWNGTTGTVIQDSTVTIDGSGNFSGVAAINNGATATTQSQGDDSTRIATTAYVDTGLSSLSLDNLTDCKTIYTSGAMFLGQGAGALSIEQNTVLGYQALASAVTPEGNTAIGYQALYSDTSGQYNVAVGEQAMQSRTSGDFNVALGMSAFFAQLSGTENVGIGHNVGATSTTGSGNILIGYQADVPTSSTSNYLNIGGVITATGINTPSTSTTTLPGALAVTGHTTFEGVTSTGATGTGKLVYDTSPTLTTAALGSSTATTQSPGDNSTKIATTAYVDAAVVAGAGAAALVGLTRNAKMSVTTASATATFTADEIVVQTALGGTAQSLSSYSQSVNLGTTGAGGMDTGSAPNNGWVSLYAIAKADGTKNILACNETTSNAEIYGGANMPSGYTYSALIGLWPTNGSGQFTTGYLLDRTFWHGASINVLNNAGGGTSSPTTYTSITLTSAVPAKANGLFGTIGAKDNNYSAWQLSTSSGGLIQRAYLFPELNTGYSFDGFSNVCGPFDFPLPTSRTMYYKCAAVGNSSRMNINGFTF